jgi:hypothetical protein
MKKVMWKILLPDLFLKNGHKNSTVHQENKKIWSRL